MSGLQVLSAVSVRMIARIVHDFEQEHSQGGQRHIGLSSSSVGRVLQVRVDLDKLCESHLVGVLDYVALHFVLNGHRPELSKKHTRTI
jgi:hypothetical protein